MNQNDFNRFPRRFKGKQAISFDDFDVVVTINGVWVPMCDLAQSMSIERVENQSAILDFVMHPKKCRDVDLFQWYGKQITVDVESNSQIERLFVGFVDRNVHNPLLGLVSLRCSERREQVINALPRSIIESIGYVLNDEKFDTQKEELDARLTTVPASFEILPQGLTHLTPWLPKEQPDFIMSRCLIYQRDFNFELSEIGGITNFVEAKVVVDYPRFLQRSIFFMFNNGLSVCDYVRYNQLPDIYEFKSAIEQAGWRLGGFDCERIEKSGAYNCGGMPLLHYRELPNEERNEEDKTTLVSVRRNLDIKTGTFEMVKRWTQSVRHEFVFHVSAPESIARFGENKAISTHYLNHESDDKATWGEFNWHNQTIDYRLSSDKIQCLPFAANRQPVLPEQKNVLFQASPYGDWFVDVLPENDKLKQAFQVAYHAAYTQILKAHRQSVSLTCLFMPQVNLTQTHQIEHSHFRGKAKVSKIVHRLDFAKKKAETALTYHFFYLNGEERHDYTEFDLPLRQTPPTQSFERWQNALGRIELEKDVMPKENDVGMIYREVTTSQKAVLFNAVELVVPTPEVESESTQTIEFQQIEPRYVQVFDGKITCHLC